MMATRGLYVFKHTTALGNMPAQDLFDTIKVSKKIADNTPARSFSDYEVKINNNLLNQNKDKVELLIMRG